MMNEGHFRIIYTLAAQAMRELFLDVTRVVLEATVE